MALALNGGQINAAAGSNQALRETLQAIANEFQSQYAQTGSGPIQKVDATPAKNLGPPGQCALSVTGANGTFTVNITLPQQASGSAKPANPTSAPIYQEVSSSPVSNFTTGLVVYPITVASSMSFDNPGATLFWRLRSTYDQRTYTSYTYQQGGAVAAGLDTSAAHNPNLLLNQSNFARIDSIGAGATATIRIYGSGGVGTSWTSILGENSKVIPAGTLLNVTYGSTVYVAWDGSRYQMKSDLTQTFADTWLPVGSTSVISNGAGLVLPLITPVSTSGHIIGYDITNGGNDITGTLSFAIVDTGGGTGATVGPATISAGVLTALGAGNPGASYSGATTVTASGGISGGVAGGGGPTGNNNGRLYTTS
ncbi:MAG TPA: hypothetical protein VMQ60_03235 [Acidobacteriaceae bacterium]|nr:hypothetical protein [Acidobacteriaceae bacterium]